MAIFKCKMCAGELEILKDLSICECEFCGTKQTIPKVKDENIQTLFNRANNLRMKAEFDKASEIYEKIIQSNEEEAEAYWGLILCKYGIEYVEDPTTFKRVPTCNRTSFEAIVADEDYKLAIEYADASQKEIYENEAKAIDEIQKGILALASREEPYDIFICYKEKDSEGKRTQDSVMANDIYYQLTQEGYRVFYAAITLEDKLGKEYEPYIFSALNSSKVMLTLGTKPEYFNAVWVKNEWSRFLKIMKKDRSRMLIPCYRDMDAYDLPEEFAHLQAQDMSKIGFINDLVRGIKKVVVKEDEKNNVSQKVVQTGGYSANIVALLKRGNIALEDGEWEKADGFFEEVLNQDATNGEAYFGKLLVENKCSNLETIYKKILYEFEEGIKGEEIEACREKKEHINMQADMYSVPVYYKREKIIEEYEFDRKYISYYNNKLKRKEKQLSEINSNKLISRCKQFCIGELKEKIKGIYLKIEEELEKSVATSKDNDEKNIERITQEYELFIKDTDEKVIKNGINAKATIEKIYNDILAEINQASSEEDYCSVREKIREIEEYKDAAQLIEKCTNEIRKIKYEEDKRIKDAIDTKRNNMIIGVTIAIIIYFIVLVVQKPIKYNTALKNKEKGNYDKAYEMFLDLDMYKDSEKQANEVFCMKKYKEGLNFKDEKRFREAYEIFKELGEYNDSKEQAQEMLYLNALDLKEQQKYSEAYRAFVGLKGYKESMKLAGEVLKNRLNSAKIYDEIEFGDYNGATRYILLAKEGDMALLVCKNAICSEKYSEYYGDVAWEYSTLRQWLNGYYYNMTFTRNEKSLIIEKSIRNAANPEYETSGGKYTRDKVFLLSIDEASTYFEHDYLRDVQNLNGKNVNWWLRSPGRNNTDVAFVTEKGIINYRGVNANKSGYYVRPAVWVGLGE